MPIELTSARVREVLRGLSRVPGSAGRRAVRGLRRVGTLVTVGTSLMLVLIGAYVARHMHSSAIVLAPVHLPQKLVDAGMSPMELTYRLADRIDSLQEAARPSAGQGRWVVEGEIQTPDVEIPGLKTGLASFIDLVDGAFGHHKVRVTWEVSARPKALAVSHDDWVVTAHLSGGRAHQAAFRLSDPDAALSSLALAILTDAEPFVVVRTLRYARQCEAARAVAVRELRRASTTKERVRANTMMGFVSECEFDPFGPNTAEAKMFYEEAVRDDSTDALPHVNLGRLFAEAGDSLRSRRLFARAVSLDSTLAIIYDTWGYSLMYFGAYPEAIEKLKKAIQLEPRSPTAHSNLAYAYLAVGERELALRAFAAGLFRGPDINVLKDYGRLLWDSGDHVGAADVFARAVKLDTTDAHAQFYLAEALRSRGHTKHASSAYARTVSLSVAGDQYCVAASRHLEDQTARCRERSPRPPSVMLSGDVYSPLPERPRTP